MSLGAGGQHWASDERLIETLRFNGIEARIIPYNQAKEESFSDFVARIQGPSPILIFAHKSTIFRSSGVSPEIEVRLYSAGKNSHVWEAVISLEPNSSNDVVLLRAIDELGRLHLLKVNQHPAQTPDGQRSYSNCRAVINLKTGFPTSNVCTQILK